MTRRNKVSLFLINIWTKKQTKRQLKDEKGRSFTFIVVNKYISIDWLTEQLKSYLQENFETFLTKLSQGCRIQPKEPHASEQTNFFFSKSKQTYGEIVLKWFTKYINREFKALEKMSVFAKIKLVFILMFLWPCSCVVWAQTSKFSFKFRAKGSVQVISSWMVTRIQYLSTEKIR